MRRLSGEAAFDRVAGHPVLTRLLGLATRSPLRVLAYHEIIDEAGFRDQMQHVVDYYRPVSSADVVAWVRGGTLPSRAVWITFDDGDPSVVESGLPVLAELGLAATLFICPGVIDTDQPFWWQVADAVAPEEVTRLKEVDDATRTRRTAELAERYREIEGQELRRRQMTLEQLRRWVSAGGDVGNHTWDHPLLDRCDPAEQNRQILEAHEWIAEHLAPERLLFAYPNGNRTDHARDVVRSLGYELALLFDHATVAERGFELSRLRTNADGKSARFRSIVSGMHPFVHRARGRA